MAKKKKRQAPRVMKWVEMGCEGVTKEGRIKKGWRPPAKKGQCPRPGGKGKTQRATKAKGCTPLIRKGMAVAFKRGFKACEKEIPSDIKADLQWRRVAEAAQRQADIEADRDRLIGRQMDGPSLMGRLFGGGKRRRRRRR